MNIRRMIAQQPMREYHPHATQLGLVMGPCDGVLQSPLGTVHGGIIMTIIKSKVCASPCCSTMMVQGLACLIDVVSMTSRLDAYSARFALSYCARCV